jgi:hypothetical protein
MKGLVKVEVDILFTNSVGGLFFKPSTTLATPLI